ncbi:tRNA-processing RNAse BN [Aeromonas sp. RU39B]|uniref:virulence factor BrkB family protein n=1 Tax=Aeromonas sp. RU39B TaxID=1907416 RepID=UPI00095731DB|nr:virulence factor BrkB family protein [Aeromonas sp. RU39B]SIR31307.1 tRNA-processing RNAse BN [Aeromonas sp. RU39B]
MPVHPRRMWSHLLCLLQRDGRPFAEFVWARFQQDRLTVTAGYLAYVTLLSLVPLVAVVFGIMSAFPVFRQVKRTLEQFVYHNLVPAAGELVQAYVNGFVANARNTTAVGIGALVVVALLLISAIDKNLNYIWRTRRGRPLGQAFAMYWMILTLGPILVGTSIAVSSYILSLRLLAPEMLFGLGYLLLRLLPFLLSVLAFWLVYTVVPTCRVKVMHALAGALLAAILFELAKRGFALYITHIPTYQAIYGALATIPILFVWVYLSWLVVLLGAELTACLGEYQRPQSDDLT